MDQDTYDKGLEIRTRVLGEDYVKKSISGATSFNEDFQALTTEYCWGAVWGREGLSAAQRSMLNIAMLTALGRDDELRLHVAGALRNGLTPDEIKEVLLQAAIYCGIPAANAAFRIARDVIENNE
ncbi:MAG: carboxymuconolactone decarboxylase family protein [Pseudomonadota bacterium]